MKGPYERLKYDLRRVWECPVCRARVRTGGNVTSLLCEGGPDGAAHAPQSTPQPDQAGAANDSSAPQAESTTSRFVVMKLIEDGVRRVAPPAATPGS